MGKTLKFLIYGLIGLVVILVGGAVAATMMVDPNDHKEEIAKLVKEQTGRDLVIHEDFSLSFFPWLGVKLGALELGNADGFGPEPFAKVASVGVKVMIMPLIERRVEVDTIILKGLQLNAARDASGKGNWEDLAGGGAPAEAAPETTPAAGDESSGGASAIAGFAVNGLDISDSGVSWKDATTGDAITLSDLSLTTGKLDLGKPIAVDLGVNLKNQNPAVSGRVELVAEVVADLAAQVYGLTVTRLGVNAQGETLPGGAAEVEMALKADVDMGAGTLALSGLQIQTMGLEVSGDLKGQGLPASPKLSGVIQLAEFNPSELLAKLGGEPIAKADANALTKASVEMKLSASATDLTISSLTAKLDETTLSGSAGVSHFQKPRIKFDLNVDEIDVDRYLPPPAEGGAGGAGKPAAESGSAGDGGEPDLSGLRSLNVDGKMAVGQVKVANLKASDLAVTVKAADGLINVTPMAAKLYEGSFSGGVSLDVRGDTAKVGVKESLSGVQAGPLLKDLTGEERILGQADSSADLTMSGLSPDKIKSTLNGTAKFAFTDGAVTGVNIAQKIRNAFNLFKGKPQEPEGSFEKTDFSELSGSAQIKNGLVKNSDLSMTSPLLRISGKGEADLPGDKVDYGLTVAVVGTLKGKGGESISELKNVTVPIKITGPLAEPKFGIDMETLLTENLKSQAKEKLKEKLTEKLGGKLGGSTSSEGASTEGVKKLLKGLPF
ncbi:MAG: AsmA family protein [Magnetococcales bacterium]|nr:AsmA family protein [Magnetococcales bacterium]